MKKQELLESYAPPGKTTDSAQSKMRRILTYGRIHGKTLSGRQKNLVSDLLPSLAPQKIKNSDANTILEIGFGGGEHLREIATEYPCANIIGAEPFINGVASLLSAITDEKTGQVLPEYKNISIWADDVRLILEEDSQNKTDLLFDKIFVLHPDPWPKIRHEKRRLLNSDFLNLLWARLLNGGQIIIGTDHHEYYDWVIGQVAKTNLKILATDLEIIKTRYQEKNKAGTPAPKYLVLEKK